MAHFAKINSDNVVIGSAMVDNVYMVDDQGVEHESYGLNRLNKLYGDISPFYWKQWSVNTYEGTSDIHSLILGKFQTNINAF